MALLKSERDDINSVGMQEAMEEGKGKKARLQ
jgi:hypothetical protein